jgi:MerR family transcriptional regulator, heat shock protein HspR
MGIERRAPHPAQGVYGISVAAGLVGMTPQTLRLYEDRGLLEPERTDGGTRRYSQDDLEQLHRIGQLLGDGLNLAGVAAVLELERVNTRLRAENRRMRGGRRATPSANPPASAHGDSAS